VCRSPYIDAHRCIGIDGGREGGNFQKLFNKNAIKAKIEDPQAMFPESIDPPRQKSELPTPPDF
jgi:hypothetical protein